MNCLSKDKKEQIIHLVKDKKEGYKRYYKRIEVCLRILSLYMLLSFILLELEGKHIKKLSLLLIFGQGKFY